MQPVKPSATCRTAMPNQWPRATLSAYRLLCRAAHD